MVKDEKISARLYCRTHDYVLNKTLSPSPDIEGAPDEEGSLHGGGHVALVTPVVAQVGAQHGAGG